MSEYRTTPIETDKLPKGIPYIIGNEAAERFCFYGQRAILVVFMTKYLLDSEGNLAPMGELEAMKWFHTSLALIYATPFLGALLSDVFWGKYKTILNLSLVYTLGCLALALDQTRLGLFLGLTLIAIGSGGIKPCVSANVGDQFGKKNSHLLSKVFGWFYFSVNVGALLSMYITPILLEGTWIRETFPNLNTARLAFGVPGLFMLSATLLFWLGRHKFVHVPPAGLKSFRTTFSLENLKRISGIIVIFLPLSFFWSLYDQSSSAWVLQAEKMDLNFLGWHPKAAQTQIFNSILVLLFIPLFNYWIYPAVSKLYRLTELRKIGIGFFVAIFAFLNSALIEYWIAKGMVPSYYWQFLSYIFLSAAEIMVSITCLEFAYSQAPKNLKSLIMACYYLCITAGNLFTALVSWVIMDPVTGNSRISMQNYYLFFSGILFVASCVFIWLAIRYKDANVKESA